MEEHTHGAIIKEHQKNLFLVEFKKIEKKIANNSEQNIELYGLFDGRQLIRNY